MGQYNKDVDLHIRISKKDMELLDDIVKNVNDRRKDIGFDMTYNKSRAVRDALRVYSDKLRKGGEKEDET